MATTTKKPAAKKTTTAAKKTTTAKPAAKETTTAKPAAKPAATPKATEISVTGNKKISTLCKEFNQKFPYLLLGIFEKDPMQLKKSTSFIERIDPNKTIASVRKTTGVSGEITISGNKKVKTLENEFLKVFGLYAEVCVWSLSGTSVSLTVAETSIYGVRGDNETLASLNDIQKNMGGKKANWPAGKVEIF